MIFLRLTLRISVLVALSEPMLLKQLYSKLQICLIKCKVKIIFWTNFTLHRLLGWVNLYQKFKIEKYTVCGKLILPTKKMERHKKKKFGTTGLRNAWICEYLQASCIQHF